MKITEALNAIYKQSKNSGLNPELFKELKKEINTNFKMYELEKKTLELELQLLKYK